MAAVAAAAEIQTVVNAQHAVMTAAEVATIADGSGHMALAGATFCMAASTMGFMAMSKPETKRFNYVAMAVTGIATMAYLAMYCGAGVTTVDGREVYWMRYVDWFFTTPFFLLDLALLARADTWDTFYVMLMNAICIVCGAIGALSEGGRFPMFILGMITFAMFNAKLFGAIATNAESIGTRVAGTYKQVTTLTMGIWCAYPVMYFLCELTHALSVETEIMLYAVLDVVAKCVCSFLLLKNHDVLMESAKTSLLVSGYAGP